MDSEPLANLTVVAFLERLASDQPAPGGGAAAGLAAACGAALIEMVCRFTLDREQFAGWAAGAEAALRRAGQQRLTMQRAMEADAAAYADVAAAYRLPRSSREERAARRQAINDALAAAAEPPMQVADASASLTALARDLVGQTNPSLVSDLGAAGELLTAALRIAALNVEANAVGLKDDPRAGDLRASLAASQTAAVQSLGDLRAGVARALEQEG
jgi:formiminotetrahydrofolate cyclodeaminase